MAETPTVAAERHVDGLAAGVQAAYRLVSKALLTDGGGAGQAGAPRSPVGMERSWAGSQGGLYHVRGLAVERAAASAAQAGGGRVQAALLVHRGVGIGNDGGVLHVIHSCDRNLLGTWFDPEQSVLTERQKVLKWCL